MEGNPQDAINIEEARGNTAYINIDDLAIYLNEELQRLQPLSDEYNSIYRVPKRLRELNEKAYTPQVVSIGPLHYGTDKLRPMEEHKRRYLQNFLRRNNEARVNEFLSIVRDNEDRLRRSYAEDIKLRSEDLVMMVLVDAAFIIEVLLKSTFIDLQNRDDRIFTKPWMIVDIMFDMCLLENQLPFFILQELSAKIPEAPPIIELIRGFARESWDVSEINEESLNNTRFNNIEHLVDFLSICLVPPKRERSEKMKTLTTPTMTQLHQAGVKFEKAAKKGLFEIRFQEGSLEIPRLKIVKETELLFRNLLAFEQCHGSTNCINDFIVLINHLVNTPKDVNLLIQFGIIENWLCDSDGVSTCWE